ncbi:MAG TPA: hypothetical protein VK395_33175 [Gemmataceae bacterium]|nr:hypothetical protein [Gemmataceae bacterium]
MNVLGVRCSNKDFTYAVLSGTKKSPVQETLYAVAFPKGYAKPQSLRWLLLEIDGLITKHQIKSIVIKSSEGMTRGKAFADRVQHEAAVQIAGATRGLKAVFEKVKSTMAKDLGQKGRAHYLAQLDTSNFPDYDSHSEKEQEAILAAWSGLT